MLPKMNPKQMAGLMRQMGITNQEIPAKRVIIEKSDGGKIVVENPQVVAIEMQGQKSFQVSGDVKEGGGAIGEGSGEEAPEVQEENEEEIKENDIAMVAEQAHVSKEDAKKALEEADGDIAEAIIKAQKKE